MAEKYLQTVGLVRSMEDLKNKNKAEKDNTTEVRNMQKLQPKTIKYTCFVILY